MRCKMLYANGTGRKHRTSSFGWNLIFQFRQSPVGSFIGSLHCSRAHKHGPGTQKPAARLVGSNSSFMQACTTAFCILYSIVRAVVNTVHARNTLRVVNAVCLIVNARSLAARAHNEHPTHLSVSITGARNEYRERNPSTVPTGHTVLHHARPPIQAVAKTTANVAAATTIDKRKPG